MIHVQAWRQFLSMGGYALYVWPSYLLVLAVLAHSWLKSIWQFKMQLKLARSQGHKDVDE